MKTLNELTVLMVEPSSTQAKIITNELNEAGIEFIEYVQTGGEAFKHMQSRHFDLTISAMYLPDMSCLDLVQMIRAEDDLMDIAYILISSETHTEMLDPIRQAGITALLPKPFEASQFRKALYNSLDYLEPDELHLENVIIEDLNVLIVDDSAFSRKQIRRVLTDMGVENFAEADGGAAAIALIDKQFFDLIITDYHMPDIDGQALTDYIRKESSQKSVPLLMVTSEENQRILTTVQQSGVSAICNKPFEVAGVKSSIERLLAEY
ncbi:MAG: response regulator [Gammaproteobacteria bacterium]|nr:response regulator [Gammaproteobacteria bacterium]